MSELRRRDRALVGRTEPAEDLEIVAAIGSHVRDASGRRYVDLQMGWCVGNLGWSPPEIMERVRRYAGPMYIAPQALYAPWVELAERLLEFAPGRLARAFRCVGGTESVELALQLAMAHTGRHKVISIEGAYHGNSIAAKSAGEPLPAHLAGFRKLAPPLDARALDRLETLLKPHDVAALIMEPTIINLAVLVPDRDFLRGVVALCHRHGTLFIADEVATGFGRTGRRFACEHAGLEPDIMTLGKAVTNGIAPLGATLTTAEVARSISGELSFYSTYGWQPLSVEAALGVLGYWRDHGDRLLSDVNDRSDELRRRVSTMPLPEDGEVRIQGLAVAIELGDAARVKRVVHRCRDHGVLVGDDGEAITLFPALTIDPSTLADALDVLDASLHGR
ncbi:MAG TPA: aspartate aminotransferase family protein [Kofleriaceae bacterium]|nr:aspartate aminotransferase family protein [Kofleriaceae bacterium]